MRGRRRLVAALAATALAACSGLPLGPARIEIPYDQLFTEAGEQFPFDRRLMQVFDVNLSAPRFRPMPERNRMATELDLRVGNSFMPRPLRGTLGLVYSLRYEPADDSVRMSTVRIERFHLEDMPDVLQARLVRIGALVAEEVLEGWTVHRLAPEQVQRMKRLGLQPGEITIGARGLAVALEATRR